jgi:hypothetical protein
VLVIDESGQEKAGVATVGVKRQYVGCAGKITIAVNVVYATWASSHGHAPVAARLYLPRQWATDPDRRATAGVPEHVEFATKPELAVQIVAELREQGQLPDWLTGDEVYGQNPTLRHWCEDHDLGYVLGVPRSFTVTLGCGTTMRADHAVPLVAAGGWNYRSAGPGSKGERDYAWAWIGTASENHQLLVRRNLADPSDLAYFYCYRPPGWSPANLAVLVRVAGLRWPVEEDFQNRQRPLRTRPQPGPAPHRPATASGAGHRHPGDLRGHSRHAQAGYLHPVTGTDQPHRDAAGRSRPCPAERRRGQTPVQPAHPYHVGLGPPPAMGLVETSPPSPRPLVPPPRPTPTPGEPTMIKLSVAAVLGGGVGLKPAHRGRPGWPGPAARVTSGAHACARDVSLT